MTRLAMACVLCSLMAAAAALQAGIVHRIGVCFGGWSGRVYLLIVILFPSNRRVIFLAPPTRRAPCRSIIRIKRPSAMPNFCGMRAVAFPAEAIGFRAVSKTGIAYVSSVHYRSYPVAAASMHRTDWNDGLLGSLFHNFHQRDPCGRGSGSSPRGSDSCGSTMPAARAMRT
jgi:hypothetical protein